MTEDEFRQLCLQHDLTYSYSDDHSVWRRGSMSFTLIRDAAKQLGGDKAKPIWNSVVDQKVVEKFRQGFYW